MSPPFTREEASRVLGVPTTADGRAVKQAYRRLARQHHPDRGGDPGTFHQLQQAYERLTHDDRPRPVVARGRPSRPAAANARDHDPDVGSIAWEDVQPGLDAVLDRDRLAVLLAREGSDPVATVTATSRAPASRLNRVAASLAPAFTARLTIAPAADDRGRPVARAEIAASGRKARRALDRVELDGTWTRTRTSTSTALRTLVAPSASRRATAMRVSDQVSSLLTDLGWPLGEWTVTDEGP